VSRRVNVPKLEIGRIELPPAQAHHLRDVLRQKVGDCVEVFDDYGAAAQATIVLATPAQVIVQVDQIELPSLPGFTWSVAAAIPKGPRADWMAEKLAELGASSFIPLITERGIPMPAGEEKIRRWSRLATQAARQSGQRNVMKIEAPSSLTDLTKTFPARAGWFLSTDTDAAPIGTLTVQPAPEALVLLIGPEGGWTDAEVDLLRSARLSPVSLGRAILRIETAAIAAGAIVASAWSLTRPTA
jgi:16S rRNA (uracil1498-N3)-methyltransferase